jgi:hypothetical protein
MITLSQLLPLLYGATFLEAAGAVAKICLSLKLKFSLPKLVKHTVRIDVNVNQELGQQI